MAQTLTVQDIDDRQAARLAAAVAVAYDSGDTEPLRVLRDGLAGACVSFVLSGWVEGARECAVDSRAADAALITYFESDVFARRAGIAERAA